MEQLLNEKPTSLLMKNQVKLTAPLLLYLVSDEPKLQKSALEGIKIIVNLCFKKKTDNNKKVLEYIWDINFDCIILDFTKILCYSHSIKKIIQRLQMV